MMSIISILQRGMLQKRQLCNFRSKTTGQSEQNYIKRIDKLTNVSYFIGIKTAEKEKYEDRYNKKKHQRTHF